MEKNNEDTNSLDKKTLPLVIRARDGDHGAVGDLYRLYEKRLKGAVRKQLGNKLRSRMETMDLVQSVWKDALSDIKGFEYKGADSFFKWMLSCIIRKIQDKGRYYAAKKRDLEKEVGMENRGAASNGFSPPKSMDPTPSQAAITDEHTERLMGFLDKLPDNQRQALVLRMKDELEFEQIAEIMDKSEEAVRKLYSRAIKNIGKYMLHEKKEKKAP